MTSSLQCPVFQATHRDLQTQGFAQYVEAHEPEFQQCGVCIIRPPRGWKPRKEGYAGLNFIISRPIRQHATGRQGLYRTLMLEQKCMTLKQFKAMADDPLNAPPPGANFEVLERKYWKNVALNPPLYGADVPGSIFDEDCKGWNLGRLESLLSRTMRERGVQIPGVNSPYLYVGSWRSTFAWHTEDLDLHSVNYLHFGAPKSWYVVPPAHRQRFELLVHGLLPELFRQCPEFLRHKELVVSPSLLQAHNIPVVRVEQHPGEFVVTYPGAYHCGFNQGFNCAESVNFATRSWVDIGALANCCECRQDTVRMDMRMFADFMSPELREELFASDTETESGSDAEESDAEPSSGAEPGASVERGAGVGLPAALHDAKERKQGGNCSSRAAGRKRRAHDATMQPPPLSKRRRGVRGRPQVFQANTCVTNATLSPRQKQRRGRQLGRALTSQRMQHRPSRRGIVSGKVLPKVMRAGSLKMAPTGEARALRLLRRQQRAGTYLSPRDERKLQREALLRKQMQAQQDGAACRKMVAPPSDTGADAHAGVAEAPVWVVEASVAEQDSTAGEQHAHQDSVGATVCSSGSASEEAVPLSGAGAEAAMLDQIGAVSGFPRGTNAGAGEEAAEAAASGDVTAAGFSGFEEGQVSAGVGALQGGQRKGLKTEGVGRSILGRRLLGMAAASVLPQLRRMRGRGGTPRL